MDTICAPSNWYESLRGTLSLGQTVAKAPGGLAALHARRAENLAQFWTPDEIAAVMWSLAQAAIGDAERWGRRVTVFDNSIGIGRLLQFCSPDLHAVYGFDVHGESVAKLSDALRAADFAFELETGSMADFHPEGFDLALINPPFSIQLSSPHLTPFTTSAFGHFGACKSAKSHIYAMQQAAEAAEVVVALLPLSSVDEIRGSVELGDRVRLVIELPGNAFEHEGATVETALVVVGKFEDGKDAPTFRLDQIDEALALVPRLVRAYSRPRLGPVNKSGGDAPTITLPVTGNRTVRLYRRGRKLKFWFQCGLTEAVVRNAILRDRIYRDGTDARMPKGIQFTGDGRLDVEVILSQPAPLAAFDSLIREVKACGMTVEVAPGVREYIARMMPRRAVEKARFGHVVFATGQEVAASSFRDGGVVDGIAKKGFAVVPTRWGAAYVKQGETVSLKIIGEGASALLSFTKGKDSWTGSMAEALERFEIEAPQDGGWVEIARSKEKQFPQRGAAARRDAIRAGVDRFLTWGFQLDDAVELHMQRGGISAAAMGLGKARQALALCLMGGKHNLICVEAHLVPEIVAEAEGIKLDKSLWQVIESPSDLKQLAKVNIISYSRLRMRLGTCKTKTYAGALRNRIHTCAADEGQLLANDYSLQVSALYELSARARYPLSGTPAGNYPRSVFPLILWAARDGTSAQPYGKHRPFVEPVLFSSSEYAKRGQDELQKFTTTSWVTSAWTEDMQSGAAREIPLLANVAEYRDYIGRFTKRRVWDEPAVAAFVKVPKPTIEVVPVEWDQAHLRHFVKTAVQFRDWWRDQKIAAGADGKRINLVRLLAEINAVFRAGNFPSTMPSGYDSYYGTNSKHVWIENALLENHHEGRKTILFATSPDYLASVRNRLAARGVRSVLYTGRVPIKQRAKALREDFREGPASTLLCSMQCSQTGLNVPEASDEIFANRRWSPREEEQAMARAIRPSQKRSVRVRFPHLPGSLDDYMKMMVDFKRSAAATGLDYATPEFTESDWSHWATILDSFVEGLARDLGVDKWDLRTELAA